MIRTTFFAVLLTGVVSADDHLQFNRDIRPILSGACFNCHGFDAKARKANLRLDIAEGAFADREGVRAVVPRDLKNSEIWDRINSPDPNLRMPPPKANKPLSDSQKQAIKTWIEQGATYQKHWSFEPIHRPAVPHLTVGLNGASKRETAMSPIDAFLFARIRKAGLKSNSLADKPTLIRRIAFTLTGLPPTVREVDEFLADRSPTAYERMVDRYLASPRFGEEMARHWLDLARYADTHGLHLDNERQMWLYRDWVVKAFNDNLPFDKFTVWQMAGDLLPNATVEQQLATGFHRCNVTTGEGGAIDAEFRYRYAVERTSTVSQAWLGLTAGCAVCHDHKYDPISAKEFYSLYAFFNSAADPAMDGNVDSTPPFLKAPNAKQVALQEESAKRERSALEHLKSIASKTVYNDPAEAKKPPLKKAVRDVLFDDIFAFGVEARSSSRNAVVWMRDPPFGAASGRRVLKQAESSSSSDHLEFRLGSLVVPDDARFEVEIRVDSNEIPQSVRLAVEGSGAVVWKRKGATLQRADGKPGELIPGKWSHQSLAVADFGLKPGSQIAALTLGESGGIVYWDRLVLVGNAKPTVDPLESFSVWRKLPGKTFKGKLPAELQPLLQAKAAEKLKDADTTKLRHFYIAQIARPIGEDIKIARLSWLTHRTDRLTAADDIPGSFIFRDSDTPRDSFVMLRGQYDKPAEKVMPGVPAVLPSIKQTDARRRLSRLDLANWLIAAENPLTARVAVNRLWQQLFGTGLVKTSFDFGTQGEPPSHPELLDWLASEFRDSGWDVKRFVKLLVMTEAFQRSSQQSAESHAGDPDNRLYARGPRLRLDAEQVRDNALFVAGLIDLTVGGRGVKTYQPPNIWEPVGYADSNTRFYLQDHGSSLYRRSLYVFLKRTAPAPFMATFDGPNREQVCTVRERTNTPMQALQLLNDVQFFEASRALAERAIAEAETSDSSRVEFLYRTVLGRKPTSAEVATIVAALNKQRQIFTADPKAAEKVVQVGESKPRNIAPAPETAAWTMIANLMLNLDETVNRN